MGHIHSDRKRLVSRVNRLIGQLEAVRSTLETEDEGSDRCYEVMRQLASIKGALRGLMTTYLEGFARDHMRMAAEQGEIEVFADEFLEVVRTFQS